MVSGWRQFCSEFCDVCNLLVIKQCRHLLLQEMSDQCSGPWFTLMIPLSITIPQLKCLKRKVKYQKLWILIIITMNYLVSVDDYNTRWSVQPLITRLTKHQAQNQHKYQGFSILFESSSWANRRLCRTTIVKSFTKSCMHTTIIRWQ